MEIIKHPGAALIVPFLDKDTVVFIRQYRPAINGYLWELPAGKLDGGERPVTCAKRELIEECGYEAVRIKRVGHIFNAPGYATEKIVIFKATRLKKTKRALEEDEVISVKPMKRKEILRLFRKGAITDAKTICALSMCGVI